MEIQGGLTMTKPAHFGQRAALAGTRVGQKLSHLTTRRVIIGTLPACESTSSQRVLVTLCRTDVGSHGGFFTLQ